MWSKKLRPSQKKPLPDIRLVFMVAVAIAFLAQISVLVVTALSSSQQIDLQGYYVALTEAVFIPVAMALLAYFFNPRKPTVLFERIFETALLTLSGLAIMQVGIQWAAIFGAGQSNMQYVQLRLWADLFTLSLYLAILVMVRKIYRKQ